MAYFIIKPWYKQISSGGIYGAEWDGSSTTLWTRTDDAVNLPNPSPYYLNMSGNPSSPFDNIMPWAGMVRVSDANAGELVAIPKFYFKLDYANETNPRGLKIQISETEFEGSQVSPAHMDRGDGAGERDVVYVGRYLCASDYKSKTNVNPLRLTPRATFRSGIHNLGSKIWQWDYATLITIRLLYLVEYANWNTQETIGYGCSASGSYGSVGQTDNMPYHTGTNAVSRTTYGYVQYRNIEGLWSNMFTFVDGIRGKYRSIYVIKNPNDFSDTDNGFLLGFNFPTFHGSIKSWYIEQTTGYNWCFFPESTDGFLNFNQYICDQVNIDVTDFNPNTIFTIFNGGSFTKQQAHGLFATHLYDESSSLYGSLGSRLMILP